MNWTKDSKLEWPNPYGTTGSTSVVYPISKNQLLKTTYVLGQNYYKFHTIIVVGQERILNELQEINKKLARL